jgi:transposase
LLNHIVDTNSMRKYTAEKYFLQGTGITVYREIVPDNSSQPILLQIGKIRKEGKCTSCQQVSKYHYDTLGIASSIRHLDYHGRQVYLLIRKRRFKCSPCNKVFTEQFPKLIKPNQRKTIRFNNYVLAWLKTHNFKDTQKKFKVSFSYIKNQLYSSINHTSNGINWEKEFGNNETIALGIDEHSHKKRRLVLTIANLTKKKLITIRPAYNKQELSKFLRSIPSNLRKRICYAATDLTNRYANTIKQWLPNVKISADCFHIIRLLNNLLWQEKRVIEGVYRMHKIKYFKLLLKGQERLDDWQQEKVTEILSIKKYRRLKTAYELKEHMRALLNKNMDKEHAKQEFIRISHSDVWNRNSCTREDLMNNSKYYRTCIETLQKWEKEIITLIETRITNGYTEGIHTKIKLLKRMSYGISNPTTYIKRMILAFSFDFNADSFHYV